MSYSKNKNCFGISEQNGTTCRYVQVKIQKFIKIRITLLYYPPSWCQHRNCSAMQWTVCVQFFAKRLFSILHPSQFCIVCMAIVQRWILPSVQRLHCVRASHIAINQPKLSDASRSSPLTIVSDICCMIYWSPPTLQHCKPHYQMWFDVAAEVNAGSDHIADHTGPDRGAK